MFDKMARWLVNDELADQTAPDVHRNVDVATPLAALTRGVFDFAHQLVAPSRGEPMPGSRAKTEADDTSNEFFDARRDELLRARQTALGIYLCSVEYLVSEFARLLV